MANDKRIFLELSSELTGYSVIDLEGTGLAQSYMDLLEHEIGKEIAGLLYVTMRKVNDRQASLKDHAMTVNIVASPLLWPICQSLIVLWYQGQWTRMSSGWYKYYANMAVPPAIAGSSAGPGQSFVPSAQSYTEQLSYRSAGAHPPGAHPTGFGSWALEPIFGDFIKNT